MQALVFGLYGIDSEYSKVYTTFPSLTYVDRRRLSHFCDDHVNLFCATVGKDSRANYPVETSDRVVVAADAYLINSVELCNRLSLSADSSPAKIISTLYTSEGEAGLDRLEGDYAFVLFDRDKDVIFCRRDPFGVRPLFYSYRKDGLFAFASVPEHLVEMGVVPGHIDFGGVVEHLQCFCTSGGRTLLKELRRLDPATQLMVDSDGLSVRRYWVPGNIVSEVPTTFKAWCHGLKKRFESAVDKRLPEEGILAAQMSGGLDSTGVVMTAAKLLKGGDQYIATFTKQASEAARAKFGGMLDETEIAQQVAAASNRVSSEAVPGEVEAQLAPGEPTLTELSPIEGFDEESARRAAEIGADLILTGWGGDDVVTYKGYGVAATLLRQGKWRHLWEIEEDARQRGGLPMARIARAAAHAYLPRRWREHLLSWRGGVPTVTRCWRDLGGLKRSLWRKHKQHDSRVGDTKQDRIARISYPGLALRLENLALLGIKHGVRFVHPMLDRELVEYALNCPPEFEFRNGRYRAPFREVMAGVVPDVCREAEGPVLELVEVPWQVCCAKFDLMRELDRLEVDRRLHAYFDFSYTRRRLMQLPDEAYAASCVTKIAKTRGVFTGQMLNLSYFAVRRMQSMQKLLDRRAEQG